MSNPFSVAQKYLQSDEHKPSAPPTADPTEGWIIAVLIDSPIVGLVWFALDDGWKSGDDIPVFYASELPHLQQMSTAELRKWYEQKLSFGGGWIRDRKSESTKH